MSVSTNTDKSVSAQAQVMFFGLFPIQKVGTWIANLVIENWPAPWLGYDRRGQNESRNDGGALQSNVVGDKRDFAHYALGVQ
jgi:hypothetical protein